MSSEEERHDLRVSGKNLDIGEALRARSRTRVAGALAKYFDGSYSGHVTVAKDGTGFRTDCVLHLTSGITLEASGLAHDAYASFDQTAERIEKRLRRYKKRLKDRSGTAAERGEDGAAFAYAVLEAPGDEIGRRRRLPPGRDRRDDEAPAAAFGQRRGAGARS